MAYNSTIKLRAYTLFLQDQSYEETARIVAEEFDLKKLGATTIKNWADAVDDNGLSWHDYRRRVKSTVRQRVERSAVGKIADIQAKAETIQQALYDKLIGETAPKVSTFEGATYAFKTISDFIISLERKNRDAISPLFVVTSMLEIFREIPEVRTIIEKHWSRITLEIEERLKGGREVIEIKKLTENTDE